MGGLAFNVKVQRVRGRFAHAVGGHARVVTGRVATDPPDHQRLVRYEHAAVPAVTQLLLLLSIIKINILSIFKFIKNYEF